MTTRLPSSSRGRRALVRMKSALTCAEQLAGPLLPTPGRVTELVGYERCESWDCKAEKKGPV